ncbi:permease prefix domain 1-containing protein [Promethearchaeum syntrophicum]|uniref:Permease prefix domain 1-containing protein n=1 Tax=Promethearchaeum syntrophicum TaxID=2594042 RepID=A0A5B9DEA8_9ARCH|nr:permease prefix domain 1-containing protein [Candidatus Prometheoarchaeum syntrophicum]QEE17331.1 hypothetical protein DSAG12_03164 [Candidatus Prometheoarchaeum syntrophicum]
MNRYNYIIDDFLKKVKEKLPSWIREDKKECTDILEEMEEHILDLAQELAGGPEEEADIENIREAIARMGSPEEISKEYKKRGTPKYYLTEEWIPWYKNVLGIVIGVIMAINVITLIFSIDDGESFWEIALGFLNGLWGSTLFSFIIISVIFIALSMEGFMPHDFAEMYNKYGKYVEKEPSKTKRGTHGHHFQREMERVERDLHRVEKTVEKATKEVERAKATVSVKIQKKTKRKPPIKVGDCLASGIFGILWGLFLIMQPIESFNVNFTPEFLEFVRFMGTLAFSEAIINLFQAFAGISRSFTQQILLFLLGIVQVLNILVFVSALKSPEILSMFSLASGWTWDPTTVFKILMYISIFGTGIDILKKLGDIGMYQGRLERYYVETFD